MKTIVISGARSGLGKTILAERLLKGLPRWSALKVTVSRTSSNASGAQRARGGCPRAESCGACSDFQGDFRIVRDKKTICQSGTDTARMKEAGAKRVLWLKSTLKGLKAGLNKALDELKGAEGVVIEGTSVLRHIKPDLSIYLAEDSSRLRVSAGMAQKRADIIINAGSRF